jgi:hypothetical protein
MKVSQSLLPPGANRRGSFSWGGRGRGPHHRVNQMQISWDDVNRTERVGLHFVARLGIDVFITEGAIARWKADPECHHEVISISTTFGKIYGLGSCKPSQKD